MLFSICFINCCVYDEDYGKYREKIRINYMIIILALDNWDHEQSIFLIDKSYTNSMDFKLAVNLFKNWIRPISPEVQLGSILVWSTFKNWKYLKPVKTGNSTSKKPPKLGTKTGFYPFFLLVQKYLTSKDICQKE